ncbi:type IV toxin-antitoxin system AbiEi family antitoxin domain-containing protein [Frondihabitans cladoniiphilus]|uniref:Type IV toxin-antitoxin system AbiEi family antitoxin domain-containing protein n=1 Tax=Frondihabitans cladoniiphilus TaxID=715785 RepID=A0ABP8W2W2_9MICO
MHPVLFTALQRHHGLASRRELLRAGVERAHVDSAWRAGALLRVRHGIYALPSVPIPILRAHRVGGRLAGASAAAFHGLWVVPDAPDLTVSVCANARWLRDPDDSAKPLEPEDRTVLVLRDGAKLHPRQERLVVSPVTCVVQTLRNERAAFALAVLDSALRQTDSRHASTSIVDEVLARTSARHHALVHAADARAESGTESVLRWHLLQSDFPFLVQEWLTDHIRVDFLIDRFLVVECVSAEHHSSPQDYANDRSRITTLVALGYVVLEFTYWQVLFGWPKVEAAIRSALLRRPPAARGANRE